MPSRAANNQTKMSVTARICYTELQKVTLVYSSTEGTQKLFLQNHQN
jgi:hypothetical protein